MKKVYTLTEVMQNDKVCDVIGDLVFSSYGAAAQFLMKHNYIFVKDEIEDYWYNPGDPDYIYLVIRERLFK